MIEQGVANRAYQALAVGLVEGDDSGSWFFGSADASAERPVDGASAFEIGALTEVFNALLLAQAAQGGKLRLSDRVRDFLPKDFPFAQPALGDITLEELATHGAGLPRLPPNLLPKHADDPYSDFDTSALRAFLANYHPDALEKRTGYSDLDAGLLGYLIARAFETDYDKLLATQVLAPLGLSHTEFADAPLLLPGHAYGSEVPHWHYAALAAGAGLRSTLADLLLFAQRNLRPEDSPLRAALLLARQARHPAAAGAVGLGWNILDIDAGDQSWPLIWHGGQTGGFSTFIGFRTDRQKAVILLGNSVQDLSALGIAWLSGQDPPAAPRRMSGDAPIKLDEYTGLYALTAGLELALRLRGNALEAQLSGQPPWPLYAYAADAFVGRIDAADIRFTRSESKVTDLVLHQGDSYLSAHRLSSRAPLVRHPQLALVPATLSDYAGDFQLDVNSLAQVSVDEYALALRLTGRPSLKLVAIARDRFSEPMGAADVTFRRDGTGHVSGLLLSLGGIERSAPLVHWRTP